MMKVSDIATGSRAWIEQPNLDSSLLLNNEGRKQEFIEQNGNVDVVYDDYYRVYRVPSFADGRKRYSDIKQADCDKWGCE